MGALPIC